MVSGVREMGIAVIVGGGAAKVVWFLFMRMDATEGVLPHPKLA